MSIGFWQVALILMIVLIIFGAGKLPRVMGDVAKGIKSFKAGIKDEDDVPPPPSGEPHHPPKVEIDAKPIDATLRKDEAARS